MADLRVRAQRDGSRVVLTVEGELDLATVGGLQDAVAEVLSAGGPAELVLDLAGVTFLDSSGLGALLRVRADVQAAGGRLSVSAVARGPARVIAIAGLSATLGLPEA